MPIGYSAAVPYSGFSAPAVRVTTDVWPGVSGGRIWPSAAIRRVAVVREQPRAEPGASSARAACARAPRAARVVARDSARPSRIAAWADREELAALRAALGVGVPCAGCATIADLRALLAAGTCDSVTMSATTAEMAGAAALARLVHDFPDRLVVGVVTDPTDEPRALRAVHLWGLAGITRVVDLREPDAHRELRRLLCEPRPPWRVPVAHILEQLHSAIGWTSAGEAAGGCLAAVPAGGVEFFRLVFDPQTTSTAAIARGLDVRASTLATRFSRAGLPAPKRYFVGARLVRAAYWGERGGISIATIAAALHASTPQSYARAVRAATGLSATEFRQGFTGRGMLDAFIRDLTLPYRHVLRAFDPRTGVRRSDVAAGSAATKLVGNDG